ncbi:MAG: hypothetical protein HKN26_16175 [Acidimicrobiales bacterium]|nr:hypothetical protein [Acidimicrobiales bacterium]
MMERIRRTIDLAKASWAVLQKDRELLLLPLLSFLASVVLIAVVAVPFLLATDFSDGSEGDIGGLGAVLGVFLALALTFIGVFFKGAMVSGANERLTGGDPTVSSAISGATAKLSRLAPWALLTATVGVVLQALRDRAGALGRIVGGLLDTAWEVLTFLVIPVIIIEDKGAIDSVKRSSEMFKTTWGENLAARIGFGLIGFVAMIPGFAVIAIGAATAPIGLIFVVAGVVWIAGVLMTLSALSAIFQTALYHYAANRTVVPGFEDVGMQQTFAQK